MYIFNSISRGYKCCSDVKKVDNTAGAAMTVLAHQLGLILFGSVSWLNLTYLDSCVPQPSSRFCYAAIGTLQYSVVSFWNAYKKNPFGKPQAEVDFACVYNL